jgi:type III secretory pathway lipoprotein EscJ
MAAKNIWETIRESCQGLGPSARLGIILAGALIALAAGYWSVAPRQASWVYLLGGQEFSETQLQSFCRALEAEGLTDFQPEGKRLRIPRAQVAQYAAALAKHDVLPASFYAWFDRAAAQSSWWSSSTQEERRWELARQKALAQIIEQMPEVESASVLIDRSAPKGLRAVADIRATVTVKSRAAAELPSRRLRQIRNLVAGAVAHLSADNVTVVDLGGKALMEHGAADAGEADVLDRMKEFEEHYTRKIRGVLAYIPDVLVTVNVELDTTRHRRTEQFLQPTDPARPVPSGASDLPASVRANTATELSTAADRPARDTRATQQTWEEHVALAPKNVTVAIAVPHDVVATLAPGSTQNPAQAEWTTLIKDQVTRVIPAGLASDISVQSYPRAMDRAANATATGVAGRGTWLPWAIALGLSAVLGLVLIAGKVRTRHGRAGGSRPARAHDFSGPTPDSSRHGETAEKRRELIRIERPVDSRRAMPHLAQAPINQFEDLRRLAPESLQAVLEAVDSRLWAPALRGASRELTQRILQHLPARTATLLREEIEYLGPVRLGDVEAAQHEILEVVRRLDHAGDLVLVNREEVRRD